jgi:hypothetical protein
MLEHDPELSQVLSEDLSDIDKNKTELVIKEKEVEPILERKSTGNSFNTQGQPPKSLAPPQSQSDVTDKTRQNIKDANKINENISSRIDVKNVYTKL